MVDVREREIDVPLPAPRSRSARLKRTLSREVVSGIVQIVDLLLIALSGLAAFFAYLRGVLGSVDELNRCSLIAALSGILFVFLMRRSRAYEFHRFAELGWQIGRVAMVWGVTISALTTWAFVSKVADVYSRGWAISFAVCALSVLILSRVWMRLQFRRWRLQGRLVRSIAVVGAGQVGEELIAKLISDRSGEVEVVGVFDDRMTRIPAVIAGCPVLGTTDRLIEMGQASAIDEIVIALPLRAADRIGQIVAKLRLLPIDLRLSIDLIAGAFPIRGVGSIASVPVIEIVDRPLKHWSGIAKRIEDHILSALALSVAAPIMLLIALAIRLDSPGPVLFIQDRFGFNNRPIRVFKFRTMYVERGDSSGERRTVRDDPRVTRIGRILRRFSIDELPQLLNVMRGEMSLVGPRAHALAMKAGDRLYHEAVGEYFHRHRVLPGITGLAQVNGQRGEIDSVERAQERVRYDLYYIDNWSLWLDLMILLRTVWQAFLTRDAY